MTQCDSCGLDAPMHAPSCPCLITMPSWFEMSESPIDCAAINEETASKKKKKQAKEPEVLPTWLMKKPRSKSQRAQMVGYCRQMGLEIPRHLIE